MAVIVYFVVWLAHGLPDIPIDHWSAWSVWAALCVAYDRLGAKASG